jgi:hypothetical protein
MSVIAPVIGFSVGTRLSAKRIELASQAARSYIDWVKVNSDKGPGTTKTVPSPNDLTTPCPPANTATNYPYCNTNKTLFCVDGDGDGLCSKNSLKDMIVNVSSSNKAWGTSPPVLPTPTNYKQGYGLSIRVYRADAFNTGIQLQSNIKSTSINAAGGDPKFPLMTLITEIEPEASRDAMDNLRKRLQP